MPLALRASQGGEGRGGEGEVWIRDNAGRRLASPLVASSDGMENKQKCLLARSKGPRFFVRFSLTFFFGVPMICF